MNICRFCVALMLLVSLSGCAATQTVYRDSEVTIISKDSALPLPHVSGNRILKVKGESFSDLYSAGFVKIPEWNSIVFITYRDGWGKRKIHIFSLDSKKDLVIKTNEDFGSYLGHNKPDIFECKFEKISGEKAVFIETVRGKDHHYELDRKNKTLLKVD